MRRVTPVLLLLLLAPLALADDKKDDKKKPKEAAPAGDPNALNEKAVDAYFKERAALAKKPDELKAFEDKPENLKLRDRLLALGEPLVVYYLPQGKVDDLGKKLAKRLQETQAEIAKLAPKTGLATTTAAAVKADVAELAAARAVVEPARRLAAAHEAYEAAQIEGKGAVPPDHPAFTELQAASKADTEVKVAYSEAVKANQNASRSVTEVWLDRKKKNDERQLDDTECARAFQAFEDARKGYRLVIELTNRRAGPPPSPGGSKAELAIIKARVDKIRPLLADRVAPELQPLFAPPAPKEAPKDAPKDAPR